MNEGATRDAVAAHGRDVMRMGRLDGLRRPADACPTCADTSLRMMREEDSFFAVCAGCGERGPVRGSAHDALVAWHGLSGHPGVTMAQRVLALSAVACMVIAAIALAAWLGA